MTEGKLNPLQDDRTENQAAANDQEPVAGPDARADFRPAKSGAPAKRIQAFRNLHESRLSFFAQDATKGETKAMPSRAWLNFLTRESAQSKEHDAVRQD